MASTAATATTLSISPEPLLRLERVSVSYPAPAGTVQAVRGVDLALDSGEILGIAGESGSGKTQLMLSILGLNGPRASLSGSVRYRGRELLGLATTELNEVRGARIAMVFQDPATALNPYMTIGRQLAEVLRVHRGASAREARERALEMLEAVQVGDARRRLRQYPHELSGGMRQRAVIAMALACEPRMLIADEPSTALDVTIQAQILDLMLDLQDRTGMAIQFISHNLAVVSEIAHEIIVMYAGRIVERAPAEELFARPLHPYTLGLIATLPDPGRRVARLPVIPGGVPDLDTGGGCRFADRCPRAEPSCREAEPEAVERAPGHLVACFKVSA